VNSREKGKRGERQWRDELRANGYAARRGQQFSGSPDSPDVICDGLPWAHFEVKLAERLDIYGAMDQARRDSGGRAAFVAHRRNYWPWLVTMDEERFYRLAQLDQSGRFAEMLVALGPEKACAQFGWAHCEICEGRRLNIHEAMAEARRECGVRSAERGVKGHLTPTFSPRGGEGGHGVPIIAHRRPGGRWLITMEAETLFQFLRGTLPPERTGAVRRELSKSKR
jgi:Holliday junction resolvase